MQLLINGILLIIFGLLAVYSTSIYEAFTKVGDNFFYFTKQVQSFIYIIIIAPLIWRFPFKSLKSHKFASFVMIIAFIIQILVFVPGIGAEYHGARGWISLPIIPNIQPAEIFKLAFIFFLASWLVRKMESMNTPQFMGSFIILNALLYLIFLFVPDFGTILILGVTALIMVRYAGFSLKKTLAILAIGLGAGIFAGFTLYAINPNLTYIKDRFSYFFTTDANKKAEEKEKV
jgi:cell division protein FtsW